MSAFRRRTPGPPPFSSMKSAPAAASSLPDAHRGERDWVRFAKPRRRFSPPVPRRLPKPNAGSAADLVNEFHLEELGRSSE